MTWVQILALLAVSISAAAAGHLAARRKGFTSSWGFICFFIPVVVLGLELAPARNKRATTGARPCPACGGTVSASVSTCPHCGHPLHERGGKQLLSRIIEGAGTLVVAVSVSAFVWTLTSSGGDLGYALSGGSGFPQCDSDIAHRSVSAAIANAPLGKVDGLSIVQWAATQQLSTGPDEEQCAAIVTFSNSEKYNATYRLYVENGQRLVQFKVGSLIPGQ